MVVKNKPFRWQCFTLAIYQKSKHKLLIISRFYKVL